MCESLFVGLCQIVGTSIQVAFRRETVNITEMVRREVPCEDGASKMESGSRREGFRLGGSDLDCMTWPNDHRVIWERSQSEHYYPATKILILSDSSECPPGFCLLELLTPWLYTDARSSCIRMNDRLYISSSLYRCKKQALLLRDSTEHGPCESGELGGIEYDLAHCFACDFWPPIASSWIDRCHSWPIKEGVDDIVRNGCHFVPIGSPIGVHGHEHKEWRISFSLAEHKLVHMMDHCQFLTYGLLKIFLKEVIDKQSHETRKLLCSYHIKTVVFWVIQQNVIPLWCPENLLTGFWVCFKLLLKWVYEGVCPNFFIPQNNLFLSKIHGSAQRSLFLRLHGLYEKGLACLLQSPSIRFYIIDVLNNPSLSICTDEGQMKSEIFYDRELFIEIDGNISLSPKNLLRCLEFLHTIEQLMGSPLKQYHVFMLQIHTAAILQDIAFKLYSMYINMGVYKQMDITDKMSCHMLKLAANFGCISDMLYIAMYYYKTFRYWKALSVIEVVKVKLAQPYLIYHEHVDLWYYIEALGGQPLSTRMRQAVARDIDLINFTCYIDELIPEQRSSVLTNGVMSIPVFVMLHFVEFLCCRHIDATLAREALEKLKNLIHNDRGLYILPFYRDISWEILGICQQITGDLRAALYSYQQSLGQYQWNDIQTATHMRIKKVVRTIDWQNSSHPVL